MSAIKVSYQQQRILIHLYEQELVGRERSYYNVVNPFSHFENLKGLLVELEQAGYIEPHADSNFWRLSHYSVREKVEANEKKSEANRITKEYQKEKAKFLKTYNDTKSNFIRENGRLPGPFEEHQMTCEGIQALNKVLHATNECRKKAGMKAIEVNS
jgi:hypothetical protein